MKRAALPLVVSLVVSLFATAPALAKEPYAEFLAALRENQYGEMAVMYLEQIKASGKLPEELAESYNFELGLSKVIWAGENRPTAAQSNKRLDEAQDHLLTFLKASPNHGSTQAAIEGLSAMLQRRADFEVRQARATKDTQKQEAHYENARKLYGTSRTWLKQVLDRDVATLKDLKDKAKQAAADKAPKGAVKKPVTAPRVSKFRKPTESESEIQVAEFAATGARLNYALLDLYEAKTYTDLKSKVRIDLLKAGAKKFDEIYQRNRGYIVGVYAHMCHGTCLDEAGDVKGALEIYEEVLVAAEDGAKSGEASDFDELFAGVEMSTLLLKKKKGDIKGFASEASDWLKSNSKRNTTDGYQGIALEYTKYQIDQSKELTGKAREDMFKKILKTLGEISKIESIYRQEAFLLRRQYQSEMKGGEDVEIANFAEGIAVATDAAQSGRWADAIAAYTKSLPLADKVKDAEKVRNARFQIAYGLLMTGKYDESIASAGELIKENANDKVGPQAGALQVQAALQMYGAAKDKAEAYVKLDAMAQTIIAKWPTRPEADDARISLGQASTVAGDLAKALSIYESVNAQSDRFAQSLYYAGNLYWKQYDTAKRGATPNEKTLAELRTKALDRITRSVDGQQKQLKAGDQAPALLIQARVLLGEMALEAGNAAEAQKHLDPLALTIVALKPPGLDPLMMRQVLGALRARLQQPALEDHDKTVEIAEVLISAKGTDMLIINSSLVDYAKLVERIYKQAQLDALAAAKEENETKKGAAQAKAEEYQPKHKALIEQLGTRKVLSLASCIYLAEAAQAEKSNAIARDLFLAIVAREKEPNFVPATPGGKGAMIRVRSQLAGLLRAEGKFDEAISQVNALIIATESKAIEPLIEKGRIMQAKYDTDTTKTAALDEAITYWSDLRLRISKIAKKPPEYYEIVLNLATCFKAKYDSKKEEKDAKTAAQLLSTTLALSPSLSGPDMVVSYNKLSSDITFALTGKRPGESTDGAGTGKGDSAPMPAAGAKPPAAGTAPATKPAATPAAKPAATPAVPAKPAATPAAPAQKPAATPAKPAATPAKPGATPAKPAAKPAEKK